MDNLIEDLIDQLLPIINKGDFRLCHKVRTAKYYGGIATIDVVGCFLDCAFCWVPEFKRYPELIKQNMKFFNYLSPNETSKILINLAEEFKLKSVRLSGGEPLLNKEHLIKTIDITTNAGYQFILETNGILLDYEILKRLSKYTEKLFIYFSIKGITPSKFSELSGKSEIYWEKQLEKLKIITEFKFKLGINIMADFIDEENLIVFFKNLEGINRYLPFALDIKRTSMFPHVKERIYKRNIKLSENIINKNNLQYFLSYYYPDLYKKQKENIIALGIMDFFDFSKVNR